MEMNKRNEMVNLALSNTIAYLKSDLPFAGQSDFINQLSIKKSTRSAISKAGACRQRGKLVPMISISLIGSHFSKQEMVEFWAERFANKCVFKEQREAIKNNEWMFVEYSHVHNDPEIGKFVSDEPYHHILATVLHEIAHSIHVWLYHFKKEDCDQVAHGVKWQSIYRQLRNNLLNPILADDGSYLLAASTGETPMATTKKKVAKKKSTSKAAGKKGAIKKKRTATKKKTVAKKTTVKKVGQGEGYKGHRVGSNKEQAHKIADKADMTKVKFTEQVMALGIAKSTCGSWWSSFSK